MKIRTKQKNAKEWKKTLNKLNQAQVGEIALVYEDEENKKRQGYTDLTDIELVLSDETTITIGDLLEKHEKSINVELEKAKNDIIKLEKQVADSVKKIELLGRTIIAIAESRGVENEKDITY